MYWVVHVRLGVGEYVCERGKGDFGCVRARGVEGLCLFVRVFVGQ